MKIEDFEDLISDITPDDLEDGYYTSIGTINTGFIDVHLSVYSGNGDEINATLNCDLGTWECVGYKNWSYDTWTTTDWYEWEKE